MESSSRLEPALSGQGQFEIPFSRPYLSGREWEYVREAIESRHWSGDGPFTRKCTNLLSSVTKCPVYLTPSGTAALELATMALGLEPGDEVILPSYTFPSTANAIVRAGLKPVFIDIREDTLNLDETLIEPAISEKTRAIMVVHYAGVAAEMEAINAIAKKRGLLVVEDAAHGVNAFWRGKPLGTLGDLGCYSFHQTKNFSCGEGGAIVVNNERFHERIQIHRQKGTNRSQFLLGKVDKYSWIDRGSNYMLSDILAAFLFAQLQALSDITERRKIIYFRYIDGLSGLSDNGDLVLPIIPKNAQSNYHLFHIVVKDPSVLEKLSTYLAKRGIETATHFIPLHSSAGGRRWGIVRSPMTVTERVGDCLLRLPLYTEITREEQERVIEAIRSFYQ